jgi:parallel beta-helix repeat protein
MGNVNYATGYNGAGNIAISGGTIDLNGSQYPPSVGQYGAVAFAIGHSHDILLQNLTITNGYNNHYIELNSSQRVIIRNCLFKDMTVDGTNGYEMIQIDYASATSLPEFGSYDYTQCDNILIDGCTFKNGQRGVGGHSAYFDGSNVQYFHTNVKITNSHFYNFSDAAIRFYSVKNGVISNNTVINPTAYPNGFGIYLAGCQDCIVKSNIIDSNSKYAINVYELTAPDSSIAKSKRITIIGNNVKNVSFACIGILKTDYTTITGNICQKSTNIGVYLNTARYVRVTDNSFINIGTDEVTSRDAVITLTTSDFCEIEGNRATNEGLLYTYLVQVNSGCNKNRITNNRGDKGSSGLYFDSGTLTAINNRVFLTDTISVSTGVVTLKDDITKYSQVLVATGAVASGGLRTSLAYGWFNLGFRPGSDFINVTTNNGKLIASIDTTTQITVTSASDSLRYIIGVL